MNGMPFQRGLSMVAFLKESGTVEQCERALEAMRWPKGDRCPICEGSRCSRYERGSGGIGNAVTADVRRR
jgi:hypothetical protein